MSSVDGDMLSAVSLLTALVGLLYSTWYPELQRAIERPIPLQDKDAPRREVAFVRTMRAMPILVGAVALALVMLPGVVTVLGATWDAKGGGEVGFDAVGACYVLVFVAAAFLAFTAAAALAALNSRIKLLSS